MEPPWRPLLVGEQNPYGCDPYYALYPEPTGSAGWRLCVKIFGMGRKEYLDAFDRANLCDGDWDLQAARQKAQALIGTSTRPIILLGAKVSHAFGVPYEPFAIQTSIPGFSNPWYILPHPSGRCRIWNDPTSIVRARGLLKEILS